MAGAGIPASVHATAVTVFFASCLVTGTAQAQWTQGVPGRVWLKTTVLWQRTYKRFDEAGRRTPWLGDGRADSHVFVADAVIGVTRNVDVWAEVTHMALQFTRKRADTLSRTGFGDVRVWVRWQALRFHDGASALAFRVGAKAPVGSSPIDAQILPLGEGQWDFEGVGEFGHVFSQVPVQTILWLGYRARLENASKAADPGGEAFLYAKVGVSPTRRTVLVAALGGLVSRPFKSFGISTGTTRRLFALQLSTEIRVVGPVWWDFGLNIPLAGRTNPAGVQVVAGLGTSIGR